MDESKTADTPATGLRNRSADWMAAAIAFALLALLFPVARPHMASNQPWRAELLTTLALFGCIIATYRQDRDSVARMFTFRDRSIRWIVISLVLFAIWGLASAFWAWSPYSAWHHTLVWSEYILFFVFTHASLRCDRGMRLVSGTFMWTAAMLGILCLIDYATLPDFSALEGVLRARYSAYAELLVAALPLLWVIAVYSRKRPNYLLVMLAATGGWIAVMLSLSKGAFLAGLLGFTLMFAGSLIFGLRRFRSRILVSAGIWIAVTAVVQLGFSLLTPIPATVDYISGKADATRGTSIARVFMWKVGAQMAADHWLKGVGADNFGVSFNESRAKYRVNQPDNPADEINSDNLIERAHNEPLQIFSELGIVGILLLLIPLVVFGLYFIRALSIGRFRLSPMLWAALGGMAAFAVSSMVSSFSFRIVQNGIVFFMVSAVAINETAKIAKARNRSVHYSLRDRSPAFAFTGITTLLIVMLTTFSLKAAAEYYTLLADREPDANAAILSYGRAVALDPDYAAAYLRSSGRSYGENDYPAAADGLRKAIDHGMGVVLTYSALADIQTKMGDLPAAEKTFDESLRIFPQSVFLRVRYGLFLHDAGRVGDGAKQLASARNIEPRQATGWQNLLTIGSVASFYAARTDHSLAPPADLLPEAAVLQYLDKSPE